MPSFIVSANDPAIDTYYAQREKYRTLGVSNELAVRQAFATLLEDVSANIEWTLILEQTLDNRARPDGVFFDALRIPRGYWEAKDASDDLEVAIAEKRTKNYPLFNTIFENSVLGVLYQDGTRILEIDLRQREQLAKLLTRFFTYTGADIEKFHAAVREFQERIPRLAQGLIQRIEQEFAHNTAFVQAFNTFHTLCKQALHSDIARDVVEEMLVQHLLTERLFRTVFDNDEFVKRNVIAAEIETVIEALTSRTFSRRSFLGDLDTAYYTIEDNAKRIEDFTAKQPFLNVVYERFFHGFSVKQADTHGIIYTPQTIVDFMCSSVEELLQREFHLSLSSPAVQILDPCVGTGNFIINILKRISHRDLQRKYDEEIFCNEVMLLPYYVASLNIEHCYFNEMQRYRTYPGICLVDTLNLAENQQQTFFNEENRIRVERQKAAPITIIIGNPPYNLGQRSENDNNKNLPHETIDQRVRETYAKDSRATNRNKLSDAYVKFFRWATDRLEDRDGIICFVSNNGFFNGIAFDGFRKHLAQDFTAIYHFDFAGNARTSGEQRRKEGGNIFSDKIRTGVGITFLLRNRNKHKDQKQAKIWYHRVGDYLTDEQKKEYLLSFKELGAVPWQPIRVDENHNWFTEELATHFNTFLPLGTKEAKAAQLATVETLFKTYSLGVNTNRDDWMYDFHADRLAQKANAMIQTYNTELARWIQAGCPSNVDDFVLDDVRKIKWSSRLKECFTRKITATFTQQAIRQALYRPFTRKYLYFDTIMTHRRGIFPSIFPTPTSEEENMVICVSSFSTNKPFHCILSHCLADLHLAGDTQCFPFYTYDEDGSNRTENITDWAVQQFTTHYGTPIKKWDMFYYTYAVLHHPDYRERYAENLRLELPRIPLLGNRQTFLTLAEIGQKLATLHLHYEQVAEYPLEWVEKKPWTWRVEKMRLTKDKTALVVNCSLTLRGIPTEAFAYTLGNRSALEWVIDQYQVKADKRSGITNDPNRDDDPEYIARLVGRIVTVSVETMRLVVQIDAVPLTT